MTKDEVILLLANNVKALQEIKTVMNNSPVIEEKIQDTEKTIIQLLEVKK